MSIKFFYPIGKEPDKDPIIELLPEGYRTAAVVFYPFFKMEPGWNSIVAPSDEEVYRFASPVSWKEIKNRTCLDKISDVSIGVKAYVTGGCGVKLYQRMDLVERIQRAIEPDLFFPYEDQFSVLLIDDMLKVLVSKGATKVIYNKLLEGEGDFELKELSHNQKLFLCSGPILLMDEHKEFVFTCYFDEASMVFFTKEDNLDCLNGTKFEGVFLKKETPLIWESHQYNYFNFQ
ncbi:DUF2711 family protein [Mesobacillus selenatarsenatis]|uniref:Alternate gene name ipa-17d n=1 Tax=Mesobacillus selenatarsenatis (strain DSM 18680 / JCM 14380 / FERM P-15431 / SF-1) TaxID=1321606 RepID=A0A0A8X5V0_MESS1|nr:DUF2711 family protein [Mesobacillus selenatarsenatis]GAM15308.1 alternate gene name ipa-17d [Mesobacillus selenatarsenatis SF-1]